MITLKEQEAVDYLGRARRTIPSDTNSSSFEILGSMLDLEILHLRKVAEAPLTQPLARITIAEHGLPDVPSWLVDISGAFDQYDQIRNQRAKAVDLLTQAFAKADPNSLTREGEALTGKLNFDRFLVQAIRPLLHHRQNLYRALNHLDNDFPVLAHSTVPGTLEINPDLRYVEKYRAFKFVDGSKDPSYPRAPFLISYLFEKNYRYIGGTYIDKNITQGENIPRSIITDTEDLAKMHKGLFFWPFINLGTRTDLTGRTDQEINCFLKAIVDASELTEKNIKLWEDILNLNLDLEPESVSENTRQIAAKMDAIFALVSDPELRVGLKSAIAEVIEGRKNQDRKYAKALPTSLVMMNPAKRALLMAFNPARRFWLALRN